MATANRVLFAACATALLLSACADEEEAEREAQRLEQETGQAVEEQPAAQRRQESIPAPENVDAPPEDAERTDSGLAYVILQDADGDVHPGGQDTVTVHYTGWTSDGEMFDSSVMRGEPATLPLNQLIAGWQEGLPLMTVGDKFRFWIPGDLAYADSTRPGAPKGMLVFDVELLGVTQQAAEPQPANEQGTGEGGDEG